MGVLEWADMSNAKEAASEKRRETWKAVVKTMAEGMSPGEEITLSAAANLVEDTARQMGLDSKRTVERLITDSLSRPHILGAWKISYTNERRGNGSHWIKKEYAKAWESR